MGIIEKIKNRIRKEPVAGVSLQDQELLWWLGIHPGSKKAVAEVTYFTCLKMMAETIGKMPLKYYQQTEKGRIRAEPTTAGILMSVRPNPFMTPTTLWTTTEMNCQHYGNGYIWIRTRFNPKKYGGEYEILDLWPMQSNYVTPIMDDIGLFGGKGELYYRYNDPKTGKEYMFRNSEIMHFKTWYTFDGFMGAPVREILKATVDGAGESQEYLNNLYKNGLTASMAMQYLGDLEDDKIKKLQKKFADKLTGSANAGKVVPVPLGLTLTPLNMSMADAQFFELRKYSALQIAGAFGIKPNQINDYEKASYANSETQQLAFYVDTMSYRLKSYEEEINAKILTPEELKSQCFYKFNEKAILRTDSKTQMEMLKNAVNNGIYMPNEAREYLDLPSKEGGDILMVNGNYIPITDVGQQYRKGGENSGSN